VSSQTKEWIDVHDPVCLGEDRRGKYGAPYPNHLSQPHPLPSPPP
jgi:hypothetical protein